MGFEKQIVDTNSSNATVARKIEMISEEFEQLSKHHESTLQSKYSRERE